MIRRPPSSKRTDTLFPYTTLFRSLTIEMLRAGFGGRNVFTKRNEAGMVSIVLQTPRGGFEIPTDAHGRLWVHFAEPAKLSGTGEPSRLYVSASDVLDRKSTRLNSSH